MKSALNHDFNSNDSVGSVNVLSRNKTHRRGETERVERPFGAFTRIHQQASAATGFDDFRLAYFHCPPLRPLSPDISAAKVKRERKRERESGLRNEKAFNPWKQRIVVALSSPPPTPLPVLSTLRHSIFHYFPIVRSSPSSRPFPSVSPLTFILS